MWDALSQAFTTTFETSMGKAGFAKELLTSIEVPAGGARPAGVPALDSNVASLLQHLADTLVIARERESEDRRDQRLDRIVDTFSADFPTGCTRDRAATTLKRIDAAIDDTEAGNVVQSGTARIRRNFKLSTDPLKNVDDYPAFLVALQGCSTSCVSATRE
ncbi:hypothetical protein DZF95_01130 [Clavibacter michiganensis]|nr:hypothetical protein DZF95_01130 [Clavibacter michiganensis]